MEKVKLVYIMHTDNLEGDKKDFLIDKWIDQDQIDEVIDNINNDSDGELSYTVLYVLDCKNEIIRRF